MVASIHGMSVVESEYLVVDGKEALWWDKALRKLRESRTA